MDNSQQGPKGELAQTSYTSGEDVLRTGLHSKQSEV